MLSDETHLGFLTTIFSSKNHIYLALGLNSWMEYDMNSEQQANKGSLSHKQSITTSC